MQFAPRLLALALLYCAPLAAQGPGAPRFDRAPGPVALTLGLGAGGAGFIADALIGYRKGVHELAGRALLGLKLGLFKGDTRSLVDAGVLFGLHPLRNPRVLAIRAGLSGIWYEQQQGSSKPKKVYDPVLGVPLEVALTLPIGSWVGLGLSGVANFNSRRKYAGLLLTLTIGR